MSIRKTLLITGILAGASIGTAVLARTAGGTQVQTTLEDWKMPGTQELTLNVDLASGDTCSSCHGFYDDAIEPYSNWAASMMGQATRDPMWFAAMSIANQDAAFVGDLCLRCHTPNGWLHGKSVPTDGSALDVFNGDEDGVGCHFCHRTVDPIADPANPADDTAILAGLTTAIPTNPHSGQYIVDPDDNRRGPFVLSQNFGYHEWRESPFHRESMMCGTCHDVSNPAYSRQPDGTYALNDLDAEHPTHDKADAFPSERTYSEWANSQFAQEEIDMGGLFGGNKTEVATCQDCHMPDASGEAAAPQWGAQFRNDMPVHAFNGGNTWVLGAVRSLYPDFQTGLTASSVAQSKARTEGMLANAAEVHPFMRGDHLIVRVLNNTGHKLPTGYPEGRRMWINVKFLDSVGTLLGERGGYNETTALLQTAGTTVFECELGIDATVAASTGMTEGPTFHFALNNVVLHDNRIPPRGFTNAGFEVAQASPVGEDYLDEQFWKDSKFSVPEGTVDIEVALYYQTTSKEYIEFLRDQNTTDDRGDIAYRAWEEFGKSQPTLMKQVNFQTAMPPCPPPIGYGLVLPNSSTNKLTLSHTGTPSVTAGNFALSITGGVPNAMMGVFVGTTSKHFQLPAGLFLVGGSVTRLAPVQLDANGDASIPVPVGLLMVSEEIFYQAACRDIGQPQNLALSNGLHVDFCD
ncbi:MAG: hypothetical protein ACI8X5_001247 [Planctomycetota bacterium]|jgi:hypothetical protein